jgi:hypothetical protein
MILALLLTLSTFARAESQDHFMLHGYAYMVGTTETGPRGVQSLSAPNMLMAMWDRSITQSQTLGVNLMLTAEKWTLPAAGYPELLQVGESHSDGSPYIDFQHPHSSPVMEISLYDEFQLSEDDKLKLSFAPRGPSSDGPQAFMHRVTGAEYNPDAPLGHHIGQDVGHISSTVATISFEHRDDLFEASGFNGDEPQPTKVDLPMGPINSMGLRWTHTWSEDLKTMASWAIVHSAHDHGDPSEPSERQTFQRTSASVYWDKKVEDLHVYNTFIFGELDSNASDTTQLSFLDEFVLKLQNHAYWGRLEVLERLPEELALSPSVGNPEHPRWVSAMTLGFTQRVWDLKDAELRAGISGTLDFIPKDFQADYGALPMTGRLFVQLTGMKMWMN